jgi:hypothetical protein
MKKNTNYKIIVTLVIAIFLAGVNVLTINSTCQAQVVDTVKAKQQSRPAKKGKRKRTEDKKSTEEMRRKHLEKTIKAYRPEVPKLIEYLKKNEKPDKRSLFVSELGKARDPRAIEPLIEILQNDTSALVRGDASIALKWTCSYLNDKSAIPALQAALNDEDKGTGLNAALALVELGDYSSPFPLLLSIFKGKDMQHWLVEGFADTGTKGEERVTVMEQMKKTMRKWALRGLSKIGDERVKSALQSSLKNITNSELKRRTEITLERIEKKYNKED